MSKPSFETRARERDARLIRQGRSRLTFSARYERDGEGWLVRVPEVYAATQALTFGDIERMARDLVAVTLEVPPDAFEVRLEPVPESR